MAELSKNNLELKTTEIYESMCRCIGEHINYVREQNNISLRKLYSLTNISIAVLSDIENGIKLPRIETLIKLALALNIPLDYLFGNKFVHDNECSSKFCKKPRQDEIIRTMFLNKGFNKDEVKDIMNFVEFTKAKRDNKLILSDNNQADS